MTPSELVIQWRTDAEALARFADERGAAIVRRLADELDAALATVAAAPLTLAEAARESGYSPSRLRHMVAAGQVPNAGRKGAPRLRRGDLPHKAKSAGAAFDAAAVAGSILRRSE